MEILRLTLSSIDGKKFRIFTEKFGEIDSELPFSDGQEDPNLFTVLYALNTLNPKYNSSKTDDIDWMVEKRLLSKDKQHFHPDMRQKIGKELYKVLFFDKVRDALYDALAKVNLNSDQERLHIQIQYDANALEKSRLPLYPWHLVHDDHEFIAKRKANFSYLIAHPNSLPKRPPSVSKINILLISSSAAEKDEERLRSKELKIREGLKKAEEQGHAYLLPWYKATIEKPTLKILSAYFTNHKKEKDKLPHIIHFDGHGIFKRRCNNPNCPERDTNKVLYPINTQICCFCKTPLAEPQGFLLFESDEGKPDYVSAERFAELIGRSKPALVVITACMSAYVDESSSVFNGIAQRLLLEVPAVVATPFKISEESITNFVEQFYHALGAKESLLEAVKQASSNMRYQEYEWYRPVIFMRHDGNEDGSLFEFVDSSETKSQKELNKHPHVQAETIHPPVVKPPEHIQYSGLIKIKICRNLRQDWSDLADYFDIKPYERDRFERGKEPQGIWEWLEQRKRLGELATALSELGRDDLVEELKEELKKNSNKQN